MKKILLSAAAAVSLIPGLLMAQSCTNATQKDKENEKIQIEEMQGIGPAIAGSVDTKMLPEKAQEFIAQFYGDTPLSKCEKEFATDRYEVTFKNGTEVKFNKAGEVIEIETENGNVISVEAMQALLPENAYGKLVEMGLEAKAEKIEKDSTKFEVEFIKTAGVKEIKFSTDGKVLSQEKQDSTKD